MLRPLALAPLLPALALALARARAPRELSFQGRLTEAGLSVTTPTSVTLRVHDDPGAGSLVLSQTDEASTATRTIQLLDGGRHQIAGCRVGGDARMTGTSPELYAQGTTLTGDVLVDGSGTARLAFSLVEDVSVSSGTASCFQVTSADFTAGSGTLCPWARITAPGSRPPAPRAWPAPGPHGAPAGPGGGGPGPP